MREINTCPILLASGYDTYSPNGRKYLFDGKKIDCNLDFSFNSKYRHRKYSCSCIRLD